ncbi:hypothetical protein [Terriglobus albidus]|uniref:hypothetical protein n=1 Tax=Terriglobus albidus TaxID=1592106 RepID=UPI0021E0CA0B|nr:hypothetical protein [Terriglobus albidus]
MIRPNAALILSAFACSLTAQQPTASSVDVLIKPGHSFGSAVAHINGKPKPQLITRRATHAWLAEQAHSVIVVAPPEKGHPQLQLRIFDLDSGERHTLGDLSLDSPEFLEVQNGGEPSVFLLKGIQNGQPAVYLADATAIHMRLIGATRPTLTGDTFRYIPAGSSTVKEIPRRIALGEDLFHRIFLTSSETLQLLPDGRAVVVRNGKPESATWLQARVSHMAYGWRRSLCSLRFAHRHHPAFLTSATERRPCRDATHASPAAAFELAHRQSWKAGRGCSHSSRRRRRPHLSSSEHPLHWTYCESARRALRLRT